MTPQQTIAQIHAIMRRLIEAGLSNQQKFASLRSVGSYDAEIGITGTPDLSVSMRDIPYPQIYDSLNRGGAYHIRMIDGALLQMCYRFRRRRIVAHRLCLFPAPDLELYDADPDSYELDEMYADIVGKSIVHVPLRFDFDADSTVHVDIRHPQSHLTIGQYPNCRIPVSAPMTPGRFAKFILRNFYSVAFHAMELDDIDTTFEYRDTITRGELAITHLRC